MEGVQMDGQVFLIKRISADPYENCFYAEHGEIGGVEDAIGYDSSPHARKFRTEADAQNFIQTQLPEWGRDLHKAVGFGFADFPLLEATELTAMLWYGTEIPDRLLAPTAGRIRLWER